jgi:hypothetical protein
MRSGPDSPCASMSPNAGSYLRTWRVVLWAMLVGLAAAGPARGQCEPKWLYGPSQALNVDIAKVVTSWDPDEGGPANPLLVGAGLVVAGSHIMAWDEGTMRVLGGGIPATVRAMTTFNTRLVVGGSFTTAGGVPANYIAMWDGASWQPIGSGFDGTVYALTVFNGELIAGGSFTHAGEAVVNRIARWDGASWQPFGAPGMDDGAVKCLAVYNSQIIAAGTFNEIMGEWVHSFVRWDGSAWQEFGQFGPGTRDVLAMTVYNGELIAAGDFDHMDGVEASSIVRWDGVTWRTLGSGMENPLDNDPVVHTVQVHNGELIAGGSFLKAGGVNARNIARWDGASWHAMGDYWYPRVFGLTLHDGALIAAGDYGVNPDTGIQVGGLSRWDGGSWSRFEYGLDGFVDYSGVSAFEAYAGELIAAGEIDTANCVEVNRIAGWDGSTWRALGSGMNDGVYDLATYHGELVAGGDFTTAGGAPASRIARWNGNVWLPLGAGVNSWVNALAVFRDELVAAGNFTQAGGTAALRVARWDGAGWNPLGLGVKYNDNSGEARALGEYGGDLIVGGYFKFAGGSSANYIARWDGSAWYPLGSGMNSSVSALAIFDGDLVAAGGFTTAGGNAANRIARWDGSQWHALGTGLNATVYAMQVFEDELFVGGSFTTAGGVAAKYIARWDGSSWQPLGAGMNDRVYSLATHGSELVVGGEFTKGDGQISGYWARWGCPEGPPPCPGDPTNLGASEPLKGVANLTWLDNAFNETGFRVRREQYLQGTWKNPTVVGTLPPDSATFAQSPGQGFWRYQVQAFTDECESAWTPLAPVAAAKPGGPTVTKANGSAKIDWTDNTNFESKYQIQRQKKVGNLWTNLVVVASPAKNAVTHTDSPDAGTWRYRLRALSPAGNSVFTPWKTITLP